MTLIPASSPGHRPSSNLPLDGLDVAAYTVPTSGPEADGTLEWDATTMVTVHARAGDEVGFGYTYAPPACAAVVDGTLAPVLSEADARAPAAAYAAMCHAVRNAGRPGLVARAISAVDIALWDLHARLLDAPLSRVLGQVCDAVPVYGSGGFTTYDDDTLAAQLTGWVEQGMSQVKIKIGESAGEAQDRDVARMRFSRKVIGDKIDLFVDANGGYTAAQAIRIMEQVGDLDIRWLEEPVSSDDLAGLRRVRDAVRPDVTAGEYASDLTAVRRLCAAEAVDCLQLDVTRIGGITEWQRAAAVAAAHQLQVSGHCAPAASLAVAAATPNLRHLEWFHDHTRMEHLLLDGAGPAVNGGVSIEDVPGHGLRLRSEQAETYRVH